MTLFDGITERMVETPELSVHILERSGDDARTPAERTVVCLPGSVASSVMWQDLLQALPRDLRAIAIDLRGFGGTEHAPVDATRGVRDFSDDLRATLDALHIPRAHIVGWALGAAVALQYALEHPVLSLILQSPVSPYGFGGTRRDGSRLTDDDAGCGGGSANPDFVQRIADHDGSADEETSPRSVFRSAYVASDYSTEHEDEWVEAMLATSTAEANYPGDAVVSDSWPGFAAGENGVLNTLAPRYFDVSGIVDLERKPPILWVHGTADAIVSDTSFYDLNRLGQLGVVADWPGAEVAPPQEMVSQTRDVLARYAGAGGAVTELSLDGVGHTPHLERPAEFRHALLVAIGYVGPSMDPAPATEAIIIRSAD